MGGGGELAYWMQLKQVFQAYAVPFPLLQLRASVQWMEAHSVHRMESLAITPEQLFQSSEAILKGKIDEETRARLDLSDVVSALTDRYESLSDRAASIDPTLKAHVEALRVKAIQKVKALEKKMTRAQRRKMSDLQMQIESLQRAVFPGNGLQERWENPGFYYARYGRAYFDRIYDRIDPFDVSFYWMLESMDQSN